MKERHRRRDLYCWWLTPPWPIEVGVTAQWLFQVRFDVGDPVLADRVRKTVHEPALALLFDILARHRTMATCQFDAFAAYVEAAEAQGHGHEPLCRWTKETIEDPAKKEKYLKSFTLYLDGKEVYARAVAEALEAELRPLAEAGLIARLSKYDTNPANNPQPPQRFREKR